MNRLNTRTASSPGASPSGDENSNSIALEIAYGGFDYFTAGDLTFQVENRLTNTVRNCEVYHVNHHGSSATSSGLTFVTALDPEVSVASNGTKYGHPRAVVASRLIEQVGSQFFQTNVNRDPDANQPGPQFIADNTLNGRNAENAKGALGNITIVVDLAADRYYVVMPNLPLAHGTFPIEH